MAEVAKPVVITDYPKDSYDSVPRAVALRFGPTWLGNLAAAWHQRVLELRGLS